MKANLIGALSSRLLRLLVNLAAKIVTDDVIVINTASLLRSTIRLSHQPRGDTFLNVVLGSKRLTRDRN